MNNDGSQLSVQPSGGQNGPGNSFDGILRVPTPAEALDTSIEEQDAREAGSPEPEFVVPREESRLRPILIRAGFGLLIFLILVSVAFIILRRGGRTTPVQSGNFSSVHLPLGQVTNNLPLSVSNSPTMTINGQVVTKSMVLSPSTQPTKATAGQLYYDKTSNQLAFYNGTDFVNLGASVQTTTNVTNVIGAGGGTSVRAEGGTAGVIPKFTASQVLGASIITDNGTSVSVGGNLNLVTPTSAPQSELRLWPDNPTPTVQSESGDTAAVELGVKFQTDVSGFITGMRFYKGVNNTGTHVGHLWSSNGTSLATATFTGETASGWQSVTFSSPVPVAAETTYVASYHAPVGQYAHDDAYFQTGSHDNGSLHALQDGSDGGNGVFKYSASPAFPTGSFSSINYWVDVMFQPNPPPARYQVNGVQIASSDLANNSDLAKRTSSQLFSGVNTFRSAVASATAFSIQNVTGTPMLTADTTSTQLIVGTPGGDLNGVILLLGRRNAAGDPTGAEGAIYYNASQSMNRCYRNQAWGACADLEVESGFSVYDEFMGGQTTSFGTNAIIGSLGWHAEPIGANGSINFNPATPTPIADRPGVLALTTPAVANQGTTLMLGNSTGGSMLIQAGNTVKTAVAVGAASNQVLRVGLHNETGTTTQPVSGAWWEANPAASPNWRYCYGNGTTATCTATSIAIAANTWTRLEIRIVATGASASTLLFGLNGDFTTVSGVTVDATNRVSPAYSCYGTNGAAQNCYWDYFQLKGTTSGYR